MRAIGTITLNLGLISIPLKVCSFLDSGDISLKQLCPSCQNPISFKRYCNNCSTEVAYSQLLSGFEITKDNIVVVDKKALNLDYQTRIVAVVDKDSVPEFLPKKFYLLTPKDLEKPYFLLMSILIRTNKEMVIEFSLRKKLHLGVIKPTNINGINFLMLKQILYAENIKEITPLKEMTLQEEELKLGLELFEKIKESIPKVNFMELKDNRREILEKMLKGEYKPTVEIKATTEDITTLLKQSLEKMPKVEELGKVKVSKRGKKDVSKVS